MPDTGRSTNEVKIRAAMAMSSLIQMDKLWNRQKISLGVNRDYYDRFVFLFDFTDVNPGHAAKRF